jgi:hypothetical protein
MKDCLMLKSSLAVSANKITVRTTVLILSKSIFFKFLLTLLLQFRVKYLAFKKVNEKNVQLSILSSKI